jgi:signal transduction histidine kinase
MAVCTADGALVGTTPAARELLQRMGVAEPDARRLSPAFWRQLAGTPLGEASEWHPPTQKGICLGCTRYSLGSAHTLLLMREVSQKQHALLDRLHRQRLELTGRLVATIAHDLRAPLAAIVFNCDVLSRGVAGMAPEVVSEILREMTTASDRLRRTIDGLLDFARLGPPVTNDVSVRDIADRVSSLLRSAFRSRTATLKVALDEPAPRVRGNPLVIEQILVNLVVNALESVPSSVTVEIAAVVDVDGPPRSVRILVSDDGPGVAPELRARVFDPFFTTKPNGTGLGLTSAREAALELGGDIRLEEAPPRGARFIVTLPAGGSATSKGGPAE